jgi:hypothetical protein
LIFGRKTGKMRIMVKKTAILLLVGLIAISSISGSFTVICHGADGHIAVEPLVHNHCQCPETGEPAAMALIVSNCPDDHDHCQDFILASHLITPTNKTHKQSIDQTFISGLMRQVDSLMHNSFLGKFTSQDDNLPAFHTPLLTVILLA